MLRGFLEDSSQAAPTLLHASKSARVGKVNSPEVRQPTCSRRSFSWPTWGSPHICPPCLSAFTVLFPVFPKRIEDLYVCLLGWLSSRFTPAFVFSDFCCLLSLFIFYVRHRIAWRVRMQIRRIARLYPEKNMYHLDSSLPYSSLFYMPPNSC